MAKEQEQVVLDYLNAFHEESIPDFARMMRHFASDAVYQPLVPDAAVFEGSDNIIKALEKQFLTYNDCQCEIHAIGSSGSHVFTERTDHVKLVKDGRMVHSRVCAVFELNADNKIISWREYWDTGNILKQMGVSREEMEKDIN